MTEQHHHESWTCPYFMDDPQHYGYDTIATKYSGGYSWDCAGIWRNQQDGRLYSWVGGGCSCNDPSEYLPQDLVPHNADTFMLQVAGCYDLDGEDKVDLMRAAMTSG